MNEIKSGCREETAQSTKKRPKKQLSKNPEIYF